MVMKSTSLSGRLQWLDPTPLFFAITFRLLDVFTTRVVLMLVPGTYEAMVLGNNLFLSVGGISLFMIVIQFITFKWNLASYGKAGSWLLVLVAIPPILNNLELLKSV